MKLKTSINLAFVAAAASFAVAPAHAQVGGWQPTKTVEFIIPAGTGGGADQMARFSQALIQKHKLMNEPMVVINKSGGAGAEGFLDVKNAKGDPHKIIITLSNLFTTPLATGVPFNWRDLTPVSMLALDEFVLWVNAESPYKTVKEYTDAAKKAGPGKFKMAGTGSKQEDQIVTVALEKATGAKFTYVPFKGGGAVATQLVGKHVDSTVNNPIEAVAQWRAGKLRPICVFDDARRDVLGRHPDLQGAGRQHVLRHAARHFHGTRRAGGGAQLLRLAFQAGACAAGVAGVHGARGVQPDRADRRRLQGMGGGRREDPHPAHDRGRVPGQVTA